MQAFYVCTRCQAKGNGRAAANVAAHARATAIPRRQFTRTASGSQTERLLAKRSLQHRQVNGNNLYMPRQRYQSTTQAQRVESLTQELPPQNRPSLLRPAGHDLFHPFSKSPAADIRQRAKFIQRNAYCPHPSHRPTQATAEALSQEAPQVAPGAVQRPSHSHFECPDCGVPLYCSEEHWADDYEAHLKICDTLRQINEDDHDLRSGRYFSEFEYPGPQIIEEAVINMTNWDTFMYTRHFEAINEMQRLRQATRLLTYPITVGSVIHELSPYSYGSGGRLTIEGVKSFSALQYTLHPPRSGGGMRIDQIKPNPPPVRIFVLGARAESSLPREVWLQLTHMFTNATINVIFIGPESMANREAEGPLPEKTPENPFGMVTEDRLGAQLKINTIVDYFHNVHQTGYFAPYDPYFDCFMLYHPGFGNPVSGPEWEPTLPQLLETKVPIICTGFTQEDMMQDIEWLKKTAPGDYDMLLEPGENVFRSLKWDLNDQDPSDISCANWGVWAFRGKRYDAETRSERVDETRRIE